MNIELYRQLTPEQRAMVDILLDMKRNLQRLADTMERLAAMDEEARS